MSDQILYHKSEPILTMATNSSSAKAQIANHNLPPTSIMAPNSISAQAQDVPLQAPALTKTSTLENNETTTTQEPEFAITNSSTTETVSRPFALLDLPPEIRLEIYEHVLRSPYEIKLITLWPTVVTAEYPSGVAFRVIVQPGTAARLFLGIHGGKSNIISLLSCNRWIYREASSIVYSGNTFV